MTEQSPEKVTELEAKIASLEAENERFKASVNDALLIGLRQLQRSMALEAGLREAKSWIEEATECSDCGVGIGPLLDKVASLLSPAPAQGEK